ncbi:MAG: hypothetical protein ACFCUE_03250 [Candidatus Bathyarchaeia archaeon]
MSKNKKKYAALLTAILTLIVISPLDDLAIAALFGTALFGFGSLPFYILMAGSSVASITVWILRKYAKKDVTSKVNSAGLLRVIGLWNKLNDFLKQRFI